MAKKTIGKFFTIEKTSGRPMTDYPLRMKNLRKKAEGYTRIELCETYDIPKRTLHELFKPIAPIGTRIEGRQKLDVYDYNDIMELVEEFELFYRTGSDVRRIVE